MQVLGGGPATLEYALVLREIADPTRLASRAVRNQLGHSLKSSLSYSIGGDARDRAVRPTTGALWRLRSELAGIGFDRNATRFFKQEAEVKAFKRLAEGVTWHLGGKLGALVPLGAAAREDQRGTCIADRFFLGGVGSLRGFEPRGVGPSDVRRPPKDPAAAAAAGMSSRDALGGDLLAQAFTAVQATPTWSKLSDIGVYAHAFANVGTLARVNTPGVAAAAAAAAGEGGDGDRPSSAREFLEGFRGSLGVGLVFPLPVGNIEVNYVKTVRAGANDRVKDGLQVGLATQMSI